jgi:intracellular multiplication protein IcmG
MDAVSALSQLQQNTDSALQNLSTQQTTELANIKNQISDMRSALDTLIEDAKPKVVPQPAALQQFFVNSIISGRAWIVNGSSNFTVAVGDTVPTYGTVVSIDEEQGIIVTSSGRIIGYQPNSI